MVKLRNRQRIVTTAFEGKPRQPLSSRLTKLAYTLALLGVCGYVALYALDRYRNFRVDAHVTTGSTAVSASRPGRLVGLEVREGDTIAGGAILATIRPAVGCTPPDSSELARLQVDLDLARSRRDLADAQLAAGRARYDAALSTAALELDGGPAELRRLREEVARLEVQREREALEARALQALVQGWRPRETAAACEEEIVRAPEDGVVVSQQRALFEFVEAGEPIVRLRAADAPVRAMAWFPPGAIDDVPPGKSVEVRFPDGTRGAGVVERVIAEGAVQEELEREGYRPLPSDLLAVIRPLDERHAADWRRFAGLRVRVVGRR